MAGTLDFAGMVPGFDFLQSLIKGSSAALPPMGQWVAPTLDPAELEKRIGELRTVQFWLEQNAKLLGTTIQAMEVQRMTLATLQTMNLPMGDLREALKIRPSMPLHSHSPAPAEAPEPESAPASASATDKPAAPAVDPLQWWGALTQQFTDIAARTLQQTAAEAGRAAHAGETTAAPAAAKAGPSRAAAAPAAAKPKPRPRRAAAR